jgi:ABC-type uncharacterized transport system involved in gliding motility auxiliary subunit
MKPRVLVGAFALFVAAVVGANARVGRAHVEWDLTAERSASLSPETLRVLRDVDRRIEITAFFPRDAVGRVEAATLLSRYRKANRRVTFRILDPQLVPGEARRLGVEQIGSAAVQEVSRPKKVEIAQYTIEIDVTSAIARLVRNVHSSVCFTSGHGERGVTDTTAAGLSRGAELLKDNGYRVRSVDLLALRKIPRCDALVVAAPTSSLGKRTSGLIRAYLRVAGKAFLMADPDADGDLTPVGKHWGIRFVRGVVLEGDQGSHLPSDVTAPIVSRYSGASPAVRGLGPTYFPRAMGVDARGTRDPGLSVAAIAYTSRLGYLDRSKLTSFEPKVDQPGPVALGAAADRSSVERPGSAKARIQRTRILAWGDVDFATNAFIGDASNARLLLQGVDWLTQPEELVTAVPNFPKVRELKFTQARSRYLLMLSAGVIPGLFLIAGAFVWVLRRGR